jgi:hypothetical protein
MVSRVTSLEGLVILSPFTKDKISCRQNEDLRLEFRRLKYLALTTIKIHGTAGEAVQATREIKASFNNQPSVEADPDGTAEPDASDARDRVIRIQQANAVLTAPITRARLSLSAPMPAARSQGSSISRVRRQKKRLLDDTTSPQPATKRRKTDRGP